MSNSNLHAKIQRSPVLHEEKYSGDYTQLDSDFQDVINNAEGNRVPEEEIQKILKLTNDWNIADILITGFLEYDMEYGIDNELNMDTHVYPHVTSDITANKVWDLIHDLNDKADQKIEDENNLSDEEWNTKHATYSKKPTKFTRFKDFITRKNTKEFNEK